MALKFFNLPKARKFDFKPRYYDPEKEAQEERLSRIREELGLTDDKSGNGDHSGYRPNLRGEFRKAMKRDSRTSPEARQKSNRRLLIIIAILLMLFYLLFYR